LNITVLKEQLGYFLNEDIGVIVYFVLKTENGTVIRMADIDNEQALPSLKAYFLDSVKQRIIEKDDLQVMNISEADERKNVIYEYDLDEIPTELLTISTILENQDQPVFNFNRDNINNVRSYIIVIGDNENKLLLYKHHYAISLIKRDSFLLKKKDERFVKFNEDLIRLDDNFQFLSLNGTLFIKDLDKLEKFFGFHDVIKREAMLSIDIIEQANILADVDVLKESVENITFARKLTKLSANSPVLGTIPIPTIIQFTKVHPALRDKLKYNQGDSKIVLDTSTSQNLFIKLLNDDFLKSELTEMYYDSLAKDQISQDVGA